jgi:hypothetical protein
MTKLFLFPAMALFMAVTHTVAFADPTLRADSAWVREAPPTAHMLAAYMTLVNDGDKPRALVDVSSPAFAHVMLHESVTVDGVARMLHRDEIVVPAHGSVTLEPGGLHLMMPAPDTRLVAGDSVEFTLTFADGVELRVRAEVRKKP